MQENGSHAAVLHCCLLLSLLQCEKQLFSKAASNAKQVHRSNKTHVMAPLGKAHLDEVLWE